MNCTSPMHMAVLKFEDAQTCLHFKMMHKDKDAWKYNLEHLRAYRLLCSNSRKINIEEALKGFTYEVIEIPCGNCINCRLDYSKDWANRCTFEAQQHEFNWFLTLSYDDEHIVKGEFGNGTLVSEHYTAFMKALRQKFERKFGFKGVKMFGCGEYGEISGRPHLHILLFNCPLPDLIDKFPDGKGGLSRHFDSRGVPYLFSQFVKDLWPYGFITIADCNWNTSSYVSQYVLKKQKGKEGKKFYKKLGIEPPFIRMSNGIGLGYYLENKEKLAGNPSLFVPREHKKPIISSLPRYYKNKLVNDGLIDYEEMLRLTKERCDKARSLLLGKQKINDKRRIKEANQKAFASVLERSGV